jgi:DNA-3-methyladenine glycosylase
LPTPALSSHEQFGHHSSSDDPESASTQRLIDQRLARAWSADQFARPATDVARTLLGSLIVRETVDGILVGRIVETAAYISEIDEASHGFRGRTKRNGSMFGLAGRVYVYRSYGIHMMLNVVTTYDGGPASAVLIRGMEPIMGCDQMRKRRGRVREADMLRGPGNLCAALGIDLSFDGHDLSQPPLYIAGGEPPAERVVRTTRIGITRSTELPWRFYLLGSTGVSRPNRDAEA